MQEIAHDHDTICYPTVGCPAPGCDYGWGPGVKHAAGAETSLPLGLGQAAPTLGLDCVPPWAVFYRDGGVTAQDPAQLGKQQPTNALNLGNLCPRCERQRSVACPASEPKAPWGPRNFPVKTGPGCWDRGRPVAMTLRLPAALLVVVDLHHGLSSMGWVTTVDEPFDPALPRKRMLVPSIEYLNQDASVSLWVRDLGRLLVLSADHLEATELVLEGVLAWRP